MVLARCTELHLAGQLAPLWVVEALQERDPRAYQLYLSPGGAPPAAAQLPDSFPAASGKLPPAFLGSTPERLYARTGRYVASEAVAGTRPRGPPGE